MVKTVLLYFIIIIYIQKTIRLVHGVLFYKHTDKIFLKHVLEKLKLP